MSEPQKIRPFIDITKKQKDFADALIETGNGTQSALKAYDTDSVNVAKNIASENLTKPNVIAYLESMAPRASQRIVELSNQEENLTVSLGASKDILDRSGFKPVERTESVNVNVDVTMTQREKELIEEYEEKLRASL